MYEIKNGFTQINGSKGKYDSSVSNPSERYGRNAVDNFYSYMEKPLIQDIANPAPILDFGLDKDAAKNNIEKLEKFTKTNDEYLQSLPPLQFEYRYMPTAAKGTIDKDAVLGAAYEEMGRKDRVSVKELDSSIAPNDEFSSAALDINKDGYVTKNEYAASILTADMYSKDGEISPEKIDGTINQKGLDAVLAYTKKSNAQAAAATYSALYNKFNLG